MDKKDKLKCYTLKANDGHKYITCDDKSVEPKKKKVKLVLKQPKDEPRREVVTISASQKGGLRQVEFVFPIKGYGGYINYILSKQLAGKKDEKFNVENNPSEREKKLAASIRKIKKFDKVYDKMEAMGFKEEAATAKPKKKKVKLVLRQPKEAATDAMNSIKEVRNISGSVKLKKQFIERLKAEMEKSKYEKLLKATKEFEATKEAAKPKPKPKPANYDMLRPEIRKNILEFAGNPKKVIEEKILVDINLRKDIKTRVINSVLEDMNKSLKELNINTSTPIYNADMRRKMKALGKGFAVGGSNSRDIYEILDDVERALGIDEYMRFLPKVEDRLEGVVKQRKQRQARERAEAAKIKKQQKAEADAEATALGDDDKREFDTIKSVRDYLKWDKDFAKKVTEMAKVGLEKDGNRFDNSLVKVKNFLLNELYRVVFRYEGGRYSYNEMKALINSDRNKKIIFNPAWGRSKLYNF